MLSMLVKIVKTEGLTGVFKGFPASMINTFSQRESPTESTSTVSGTSYSNYLNPSSV